MKLLLLLAVGSILIARSSFPQDCTEASLLQTAGKWKEGMKGSQGGSAADLAREKKNVAAIHAMIKAKYVPTGVDALFQGIYNSSSQNIPVISYGYSIIPLNYYCDGPAIKTAHETSTYFQIGINTFDAEIYGAAQGDRAMAEGYSTIPDMPVEKDGYFVFKEKDAGLGFGMTGKSSAWLITHDGKLPFAYVTKREFLDKRKANLSVQMLAAAAELADVLKRIEIERTYKEAELKNDPEKLNKYMKMDYLNIKARYEKQLAENEKKYASAFDKIGSLLQMPAAELNKSAIVKTDPHDPLSYLFTDDDDPFGGVLIKPNPGYFNKSLPKSSPQFIWIHVRANQKESLAAKFMADIRNAIDFAALKSMLVK